jgi:GT2 family glycosyltransferase
VIFIDNASKDYNEADLRIAFGDNYADIIEFMPMAENLGYAKGMNMGLSRVLGDEDSPEWVMTLNNDTELEPDFFEKLDKALRSLDRAVAPGSLVGMLGPKIRAMADRTMLDATGIGLCLDGMSTARGQRERDDNQYDSKIHILIPNGVSGIYKLSMLRDVGLLDESFWAYCEDTDLGLRAWLAGWDCRFLPECVVYHARSTSHGEFSLGKLYYTERNHYWVAVKNLPLPLLLMNPTLSAYRYLVQAYAVIARRGQGHAYGDHYSTAELCKATWQGVSHAVKGLPQALRARKKLRSLRRRSTLEVLLTIWQKRLRFDELILK